MTATGPDRPLPTLLIYVRKALRWSRYCRHRLALRGKLRTGRGVSFGAGAVLLPPEFIHLGNNVSIGRGFHLESNLTVGDDVLISSQVAMVGNDHKFDDRDTTIFWNGRSRSSTVILEGDNLVGFGSLIVGTVRIGKGCIIGARAVVTTDLPGDSVCVGIPAKVIRSRYSEWRPRETESGDSTRMSSQCE